MSATSLPQLPAKLHVGWTEVHDLSPGGRETGDPLGFRAAAARWSPQLVPVVTNQCCRVRRLSVFCLCLRVAHSSAQSAIGPRERFLRCERLWLLAHTRDGRSDVSFAGVEAAGRRLAAGAPYDISIPYLSAQLTTALWGQCRRPAAQLGLITGSRGGPERWKLTEAGHQLAQEAAYAVCGNGHLGSAVTNDEVNAGWLESLFPSDREPVDPEEGEVLEVGRALVRHDARRDGEFARLQRAFQDGSGRLELSMAHDDLTAAQARALDVLRALDRLARAVERPYRKWLQDGETQMAHAALSHHAWGVLAEAGEHVVAGLGDRLAAVPTMRTVQAHHERLAESRGSTPWSRRAVSRGTAIPKFEPIETRLDAIGALFADGVDAEDW